MKWFSYDAELEKELNNLVDCRNCLLNIKDNGHRHIKNFFPFIYEIYTNGKNEKWFEEVIDIHIKIVEDSIKLKTLQIEASRSFVLENRIYLSIIMLLIIIEISIAIFY